MNLNVYSIKDRALNAFLQPIFSPQHGHAIRLFTDLVNDRDSQVNKHPDDYDLYHVGTWDDATGKLTSLDTPEQIALGKNLIRQ